MQRKPEYKKVTMARGNSTFLVELQGSIFALVDTKSRTYTISSYPDAFLKFGYFVEKSIASNTETELLIKDILKNGENLGII